MQGSARRRRFTRLSRVPPVLWCVTALFGLLLVAWSLLAPMSRAPDEQAHADLVLQQATGASYPEYDGRQVSKGVLEVFYQYAPGFLGHWLTAEDAPPRDERKTLAEWGGNVPSATPNQLPQHPPLYYKVMSSALRIERKVAPGDAPLEDEWWFLRLVNVLMVLPIPPLAWFAARRLGASNVVALTAAAIPLAVPQLTHIGASINNDNLLILFAAILAALLAGVLGGAARTADAIAIGVVTGLALLTKAFALAFIPWIALVYGYRAWRVRAARKEYAIGLLVAGIAVAVVGAWWYVSNLVRFGKLSPNITDKIYQSGPASFHADPVWYAGHFSSSIVQRFWGNFGWYEAPMTQIVVIAATVVAVAGILVAFLPRRRPAGEETAAEAREATPSRGGLAVYFAVFPLLFVSVAKTAYGMYEHSGKTPFMQGRYLFAAIIPFAVVLAIGLVRVIGRWGPLAVLGAAAVMQIDGARVALRAWWAEPQASVSRKFDALLAWSPAPSFVIYAVLFGLIVGAVGTAYWLYRTTRPSGPDDRAAKVLFASE